MFENPGARVVGFVFFLSATSASCAFVLGDRLLGMWLAAPALALSALAFGGHLVTLDDDYPGGWSNPGGSQELWRSSLRDLTLKLAVFLLTLALVAFYW